MRICGISASSSAAMWAALAALAGRRRVSAGAVLCCGRGGSIFLLGRFLVLCAFVLVPDKPILDYHHVSCFHSLWVDSATVGDERNC
ncbi:hypothetical protein HDK77DRAFT_454201 [Phyllosticta capitalensis]|uniref:uncharacterized protein n=1 Tax=Phyllosticta capitalensis TaxID=121624 RepID=UPI00312EB583